MRRWEGSRSSSVCRLRALYSVLVRRDGEDKACVSRRSSQDSSCVSSINGQVRLHLPLDYLFPFPERFIVLNFSFFFFFLIHKIEFSLLHLISVGFRFSYKVSLPDERMRPLTSRRHCLINWDGGLAAGA